MTKRQVQLPLTINYLNFKDEDPEYAEECLDTAIALYDFAVENRGLGYDGGFILHLMIMMRLAWAAVWLHIATGEWDYIDDIIKTDDEGFYTGYLRELLHIQVTDGKTYGYIVGTQFGAGFLQNLLL